VPGRLEQLGELRRMHLRVGLDQFRARPPPELDVTSGGRRVRLGQFNWNSAGSCEKNRLTLKVSATIEEEFRIDRSEIRFKGLDPDPSLLAKLSERGLPGRLARLDAAARKLPPFFLRKNGAK